MNRSLHFARGTERKASEWMWKIIINSFSHSIHMFNYPSFYLKPNTQCMAMEKWVPLSTFRWTIMLHGHLVVPSVCCFPLIIMANLPPFVHTHAQSSSRFISFTKMLTQISISFIKHSVVGGWGGGRPKSVFELGILK